MGFENVLFKHQRTSEAHFFSFDFLICRVTSHNHYLINKTWWFTHQHHLFCGVIRNLLTSHLRKYFITNVCRFFNYEFVRSPHFVTLFNTNVNVVNSNISPICLFRGSYHSKSIDFTVWFFNSSLRKIFEPTSSSKVNWFVESSAHRVLARTSPLKTVQTRVSCVISEVAFGWSLNDYFRSNIFRILVIEHGKSLARIDTA
jgi:hypothetical protein